LGGGGFWVRDEVYKINIHTRDELLGGSLDDALPTLRNVKITSAEKHAIFAEEL
jgi:hypothetical protein